ncbi:hypothetical protein [Streptomyces candidus]|uniref:Uncharacterized protein n=1 Tax=Streptomyces candidus TaxID=67283 RepID=A0A7X0LQM5_9ACTN|nr:hypothetical protein [Streptomyces candidus]MBB6436081.1 hypothetical protein [Streptomyces candidus]
MSAPAPTGPEPEGPGPQRADFGRSSPVLVARAGRGPARQTGEKDDRADGHGDLPR